MALTVKVWPKRFSNRLSGPAHTRHPTSQVSKPLSRREKQKRKERGDGDWRSSTATLQLQPFSLVHYLVLVQQEHPEMEAKCMAKDALSSLPSNAIEIILCHLTIRDAVRTSILSRDWRYKWATIPKLVFCVSNMFDKSNNEPLMENTPNGRKQLTQVLNAIQQVLLLHEGPILEFTLFMGVDNTCAELDQIILHLLRRNTIKKLRLDFCCESSYTLPLSILSFHQLTDLSLSWCHFDFSPTFGGFSSLTSLSLYYVDAFSETFLHLIYACPLLKHLSLGLSHPHNEYFNFESFVCDELFKCLSMSVIEHLTISSWSIECFATGVLPTTLVHLKSLCMLQMKFSYESRLLALFHLIRSSPNLEKIKLEQEMLDFNIDYMDPEIHSLDDYSDIWLEYLNELVIENFTTLELELEFVKLILDKSLVLKKVRIVLDKHVSITEEVKILRILLCLPRASPAAKIIVERW